MLASIFLLTIISSCITITQTQQMHTTQAAGDEKVSGDGNRRVHHIKAVIIEGKAHRCIHARVLLLQNGKQH